MEGTVTPQPQVVITKATPPKNNEKPLEAIPPFPPELRNQDQSREILKMLGLIHDPAPADQLIIKGDHKEKMPGQPLLHQRPPALPAEEPGTETLADAASKEEEEKKEGEEDSGSEEDKPAKRRSSFSAAAERFAEAADRFASRVSEAPLPPAPVQPQAAPNPYADQFEPMDLAAFHWLQERDPRFKGRNLAAETVKWDKTFEAYKTQWETEHTGEEFEENAREHRPFFQSNPAPIENEDFLVAKGAAVVAQDMEARYSQQQAQWMFTEIQKVAMGEGDRATQEFKKSLGGEPETLQKKDPATAMAMSEITGHLAQVVQQAAVARELSKQGVPVDVAGNYPQLYHELHAMEAHYEKSRPSANERAWQGRQYARVADLARMNPQQRSRVWTVLDFGEELRGSLVSNAMTYVKGRASQLGKWFNPSEDSEEPAKGAEAKAAPAPTNTNPGKRKPPESVAAGGTSDPGKKGGASANGGLDMKSFFS